ncbi:MAG: hypothetical protein HY840_11715 [Bacteroidetes bacterium]|nr:hypothetical protein [Bacteroidota bacterium]
MAVPLTFRDPEGYPYTRDAADVLYAKARGQNCELYFESGEPEVYGYPLIFFHQKVWESGFTPNILLSCLAGSSLAFSDFIQPEY